MLICPADRIVDIQEAEELDVKAEIRNIDFKFVREQMRKIVREVQSQWLLLPCLVR